MNKTNFIKHMNALVRANDTLCAIVDAVGGDFDNDLTRLLDEIPEIYADIYNLTDSQRENYFEILWRLVMDGEFHYEDIHIANWEEFYDYFFVK